jgi:hypothetical protein
LRFFFQFLGTLKHINANDVSESNWKTRLEKFFPIFFIFGSWGDFF